MDSFNNDLATVLGLNERKRVVSIIRPLREDACEWLSGVMLELLSKDVTSAEYAADLKHRNRRSFDNHSPGRNRLRTGRRAGHDETE